MHEKASKIALIGVAGVALVGVVVGTYGTARRMGFFTKAAADYAPVSAPTVQATSTSAIIRWQTKAPVVAILKYGTTESALTIPAFESIQETHHTLTLPGLVADKTYYYTIEAHGETYNDTSGRPYQFRTLPGAQTAKEYPSCEVEGFKARYGASQGDANYSALFDINQDGTINSADYFECLKGNPSR